MKPVADTTEGLVRVELSVGDTVRVLTKSGERPRFRETQIEPDFLEGDDVRIPYDDMVFVEKKLVFRKPLAASAVAASVVLVQLADGIFVPQLPARVP
jgi:hypothetical protein